MTVDGRIIRLPSSVARSSRNSHSKSKTIGLVLILALAAYLRLTNLAHNPGWYTDEATHLDIAQHLLHGQTQYLAITQSFLLFGRMPLFEWLLAGALTLGGDGMLTLRVLTGLLGVVAVGVLYWAVRPLARQLAMLAALLLAIYPSAILYSRLGFSYNLLTPLVLVAWRGLTEYWYLNGREYPFLPSARSNIADAGRNRLDHVPQFWLALACLAVGLGLLGDLSMGVLMAPVLLIVLLRRWQDAVWAMPLLVLPLVVYAASQLVLAPQAFLFDMRFTLARLNAIPLAQQAATLVENITRLFGQDGWMLAGPAGLVVLKPAPARNLALLLFIWPIAILGRTLALYSLSFYYMIPLLPLVALGVAALIHALAKYQPGLALAALMLALIFLPATLRQLYSGFVTPIDDFLINPADARAVAQFVNQHSEADDVMIASPAVAWLLHGHAADFQMMVAATGQATVHLPANIPTERFAFDARDQNARYLIVDNLWRNWAAVHMLSIATRLQTLESWPIIFQSGEIVVYQNPSLIR